MTAPLPDLPRDVLEVIGRLLEVIGRIADTAENLLAAASLPVSADIHVEGMRSGLEDIRDMARKIVPVED